MYLHKRGNVWWSEFTRKGVRHQFSTGKTSKAEAAEFVRKMKAVKSAPDFERAVQIARAIFADTAGELLSLDDAWTKYEETAKALGRDGLSDTSYRKRKNAVTNFIRWIRKEHPSVETVDKVSATIASEYAQELAKLGRSAKTRINILGDLGAVWRILEKAGDEIKNPWSGLNPKGVGSVRLDAFTPAEEDSLFAAAKKVGKDWFPVCMLLRHTGLRYHDVAMLRWDEVYFGMTDATASAQQQVSAVIRIRPKKTKRHGISVAIPLIREVTEALLAIRDDGREGVYCFPVHAANWGVRGSARKALNFQEVMDAAGVAGNFTIHSWRHTAATRLAEAGADIETRMRLLGHTEKETARRYDHDEHLEESRYAIERAAEIRS